MNDYLNDQVLQGSDFGMVAEWTVDGSKIVPSRTSSISEFQVDDPTTPADDYPYTNNVTNYYTDAELITARDNAVLTSVVSINDNALNNEQLGWFKIPYGSTGTVTSELARFASRQGQEWEEHRDLVTQLQTQIVALPTDYVDSWHSGIYYATNADASAAQPSDVLDARVNIVGIPWGFSTPVTTITGAGTNNPTFEYKTTFTTNLQVYQRKDTTYGGLGNLFSVVLTTQWYESITPIPPGNGFLPSWSGDPGAYSSTRPSTSLITSPLSGLPGTVNGYPTTQDAALGYAEIPTGWPATSSAQIVSLKSSLLAYTVVPPATTLTSAHTNIPGVQTWEYQYTTSVVDSSYDGYISLAYLHVYKCTSEPTHAIGYPRESQVGMEVAMYRTSIGITYNLYGYSAIRILKTIATSLRSAADAGHTTISKGTGTQTNLDWGSYLVGGTPPARLTYSTNQQTLNFTGWAAPANSILPQNAGLTFPGATFLLQNGAIAPIYPTYTGAYVYDTVYQKWGKFKGNYKCLVDYAPLNSNHQKVVSFSNFGMDAGTLNTSGYVTLFSSVCSDSYLKWGRLGFYRQGYTYPEVVSCHFTRPFTGEIEVEASLDGRSVHASLTESQSFTGVGYANMYPSYAAKWFNFSITGEFDIRNLEFTGRISGRR